MAEVAHDRDRGGGSGLAVERCLRALREHAELRQLRCEQLLVGRHHRLAGGERGDEDRLDHFSAGRFDDHVDFGIAHQIEPSIGDRNPQRARTAIFRHVAHRDSRHAELHPIPLRNRAALAMDHLEQAAADGAAADQPDANLPHRLDTDTFKARTRRGLQRLPKGAGAAQQIGKAILIGQKGIVAKQRLELPQR